MTEPFTDPNETVVLPDGTSKRLGDCTADDLAALIVTLQAKIERDAETGEVVSGVHRARALEQVCDVLVENHGSLFLVRPYTDVAKTWLEENVSEDSQWFGGALAVEPRYLDDLVEALRAEGLEVTS